MYSLLFLPLGELAKRIYVPYFVLKRIKYMINSKRTFSQLYSELGGNANFAAVPITFTFSIYEKSYA